MKTIKAKYWKEVPKNFTGKVEYEDGAINFLLNRECHRLDGPAVILDNGDKAYYINGKCICDSYHKDYKQIFYNSKEYKNWMLLENMKRIKNI